MFVEIILSFIGEIFFGFIKLVRYFVSDSYKLACNNNWQNPNEKKWTFVRWISSFFLFSFGLYILLLKVFN